MASIVAVALANNNAFDANHAKQNMKETYRDDKAACSTLAASLKR